MQLIGDSIFWNIQENEIITVKKVYLGIADAVDYLSKKQLKSKLNKIRSDTYIDIFSKIGEKQLMTFKKSEVKKIILPAENRVFNDFFKKS